MDRDKAFALYSDLEDAGFEPYFRRGGEGENGVKGYRVDLQLPGRTRPDVIKDIADIASEHWLEVVLVPLSNKIIVEFE